MEYDKPVMCAVCIDLVIMLHSRVHEDGALTMMSIYSLANSSVTIHHFYFSIINLGSWILIGLSWNLVGSALVIHFAQKYFSLIHLWIL